MTTEQEGDLRCDYILTIAIPTMADYEFDATRHHPMDPQTVAEDLPGRPAGGVYARTARGQW